LEKNFTEINFSREDIEKEIEIMKNLKENKYFGMDINSTNEKEFEEEEEEEEKYQKPHLRIGLDFISEKEIPSQEDIILLGMFKFLIKKKGNKYNFDFFIANVTKENKDYKFENNIKNSKKLLNSSNWRNLIGKLEKSPINLESKFLEHREKAEVLFKKEIEWCTVISLFNVSI
jgi:hypothetical protein